MSNAESFVMGAAAGQAPTLSTEGLSVGYGRTAVVDGIRIRVEAGEILCFIGPNGAGKSTILKTLIRQLAPMEGAVLLEPTTDEVTYSDGMTEEVYGFDIPVPAIGEEFDCALVGEKGKWYDHKVKVTDPVKAE